MIRPPCPTSQRGGEAKPQELWLDWTRECDRKTGRKKVKITRASYFYERPVVLEGKHDWSIFEGWLIGLKKMRRNRQKTRGARRRQGWQEVREENCITTYLKLESMPSTRKVVPSPQET